MKKILFATNNAHKIREANYICKGTFFFESLKDRDIIVEIPETGQTFEENALIKARYIYNTYQYDCIAEDSGLVVDVLDGAPGIYSARYAGEPADHARNIQLLLKNLSDHYDRSARFVSTIALIIDGSEHLFHGTCTGKIGYSPLGEGGFGYDPVFIPDGYNLTFAQLGDDIKGEISHRKKSLEKMLAFFINSK